MTSLFVYIIIMLYPVSWAFFTNGKIIKSIVNEIGYFFRDLEGTGSIFDADASTWSTSSPLGVVPPPYTTTCLGVPILGGYQVLRKNGYFAKSYNSLPSHDIIYMRATVYILDGWEVNEEGVKLYIDDKYVQLWPDVGDGNTLWPSNVCGGSYLDLGPVVLLAKIFHSGPTLSIRFQSGLSGNADNESWGIRDLSVLLAVKKPGEVESVCGVPPDTYPVLRSNQCKCGQGFYWDGSTCRSCDPACEFCFGETNGDCFSCATGYNFYLNRCLNICPGKYLMWDLKTCNETCNSPYSPFFSGGIYLCLFPCQDNEYLYWDNSCLPTCPSPFTSDLLYGAKICKYNCNEGEYLYWDSTCLNHCNGLVSTTYKSKALCTYPCNSGEFLYWDGSCNSTCPLPLDTRIFKSKSFCDYKCTNDQFLYWNGTCGGFCNNPLQTVVDKGKNFCIYPCNDNEFLYWNGSCFTSCNPPLVPKVEGGKRFCDYPCQDTDYLYWNGSCLQRCRYPLKIRIEANKKYCDFICDDDFLFWNQTCDQFCVSPFSIVEEGGKKFCVCTGNYTIDEGMCAWAHPIPS